MRRVFGFVACASLLTAGPWWATRGETAEPVRTRAAAGNADTSASPLAAGQLFLKGRQDYLAGRYAEAVAELEAASRASDDLTASDRERLPGWLAQARSKATGSKAAGAKSSETNGSAKTDSPTPETGVVARGQSADQAPQQAAKSIGRTAPKGSASDAQKSSATDKQRIAEARRKFNDGKIAEAEKLANECKKMGLKTRMFGDSPERLLEEIKECKTQEAIWRKDNSSNVSKRGRSNYLVKRASEMMEEGDIANSDRLLREAEQLDVQRTSSDPKPEHLRQQLARKMGGSQRPASPAQPEGTQLADVNRTRLRRPGADASATSRQSGNAAAGNILGANDRRSDARKLPVDKVRVEKAPVERSPVDSDEGFDEQSATVQTADVRRSKGRFASTVDAEGEGQPDVALTADTKRSTARSVKDRPEMVEFPADDEADASLLPPKKTVAKSQSNLQSDRASGSAADRAKAQTLMNQAQLLLHEGRSDEARAKVQQAEKLDVAFDVLEITPDYLMAQIERAESDALLAQSAPVQKSPATQSSTGKPAITPAKPRTGPVTPKADTSDDLNEQASLAANAKRPQKSKLAALTLTEGVDDDPEAELLPQPKSKSTSSAKFADARKREEKEAQARKQEQRRQEAIVLMKQAQADLDAGNIAQAKSKAARANDMDVAWDLLDMTPDVFLEQAARVEKKAHAEEKRLAQEKAHADEIAHAEEKRLAQEKARADEIALVEENPRTRDKALAEEKSPSGENERHLAAQAAQLDDLALPDEVPEMASEQIAQTEAAGENEVEVAAVVNPARVSALEMYQRGKQAIRSGDSDLAVRCFLQAHQSGERLDGRKDQEIREYLAQHRVKPKKIQLLSTRHIPESDLGQPAGDELPRRAIDQVDDQRLVAVEKLRNETRNSVFRAESLAATDPQKALEMIDKAQANVENSGLDNRITGLLVKQLAKSRENIEYNRKINASKIEMAKRKIEVQQTIKLEEQTKIRIEQDYAEKVEKYNQLLREKRFDEAVVIGKQAQLLLPNNPASELMVLKAKFAKQDDFNKNLREKKADMFTKQLNDVDLAGLSYVEDIDFGDLKKWQALTERRKKYKRADNHIPTSEEQKIERSLSRDVSLHFDDAPLADVIKQLQNLAEVNIVFDSSGLEEEGVASNSIVSINVDGIRLKSALNLLLEPLHLGYTIKDEVLIITSRMQQQGELVTLTYSVADLVVPIRDFSPIMGSQGMISSGYNTGLSAKGPTSNMGQMNVTSTGGLQRRAGQAFAQVDDRETSRRGGIPRGPTDAIENHDFAGGGGVQADFTSLMNLISTTVQPDSWEDLSGPGSMMPYRTTLSLVIRQTQAVHEEIADLLGQLRRLQDLQVTIECRFITVEDNFFERIGIDFNFNLQSNVGNQLPNTFGQPVAPFGNGIDFSAGGNAGGQQGGGQQGGGQQGGGQQGGAGGGTAGTTGTNTGTTGTGGGAAPFSPGPTLDTHNQSSWPRYGDVVGLLPGNTFANNLDIPFQQGSFGIGVPTFGNFNPAAGLQVGFAILSDIETFFLINAAQGDTRNNLLFAPKVTLFNGQTATVTDTVQRPFVTSLTPTVGFGAVGFTPQITVLPEGVMMTVQAVISADRRYVRLTVIPSFTAITDVQQFSFVSGAGASTIQGNTGGGGQQAGLGGGFGGGQGGQAGFGGIGGGSGGTAGGQGGGQQGQGGQQQGASGAGGSATTLTIQRPIFEIVSVATTVSVPDGGTVLLGGIKRLREGRNMAGVPILNKIPYVSRLFKNTGVGRTTQSLMLMVTPRIIIQEEEEELLGVDLPAR